MGGRKGVDSGEEGEEGKKGRVDGRGGVGDGFRSGLAEMEKKEAWE